MAGKGNLPYNLDPKVSLYIDIPQNIGWLWLICISQSEAEKIKPFFRAEYIFIF